MDDQKKVILVPGWMNERGAYGEKYEVLEIWKDRLSVDINIKADWLISHSMGCAWALLNWEKNKEGRLILVNPLFPRRSVWQWFFNWIKFQRNEVMNPNKKIIKGLKRRIFALKQFFQLTRTNFVPILEEIPKENLIVIRGREDFYFCDQQAVSFLENYGIRVIEVPAGHDWHENIDQEVEKIIRMSS